jgi:hypothetical protein
LNSPIARGRCVEENLTSRPKKFQILFLYFDRRAAICPRSNCSPIGPVSFRFFLFPFNQPIDRSADSA